MRSYSRNKDKLTSNDEKIAQKAAQIIAKSPTNRRSFERDNRGRFVSPKRVGGSGIVENPRQPRQPRGGSLWSQTPSKSSQAQANAKADAQREAVEDQTKETIERQDKTNDLLEELVKESRKKSREDKKRKPIVQGGSDGLDLDIGGRGRGRGRGRGKTKKPGFLRRLFGGRGAKVAAGVAGAVVAEQAAEALADKAPVRDANGRFVKKGAAAAEEAATKKGAAALAEKSGMKAVGKIGLRALPVIGTALTMGIDAVQGWNDTEGQADAFGVKDGQDVTTRQKAEYTLANVADMGGLVSGLSGVLAMGADSLGMEGVAKAMTFSTADMARGIDSVGDGVSDAWDDFKSIFSSSTEDSDKKADERNEKLMTAVSALGLGQGNAQSTALTPAGQTIVSSKAESFAGDITAVTGTRTDGYRLGGNGAKLRNKRNNNFGNLSFDGWVKNFEGAQLEARPGDGGKARFASFATPDQGIRANATQLHRYGSGEFQNGAKGKLNTVAKVINTWAPPGENRTSQYIQTVCDQLGVKPNDVLNLDDPNVVEALMRAIAKAEGGDISMSSEAFQASLGKLQNGRWVAQEKPEEIRKKIETSGAVNIGKVQPIESGEPGEGPKVPAQIMATLPKAAQDLFKIVQMGDAEASQALAGMGIGHFGVKKDPGLTLPKGAAAMPWLTGGGGQKLSPLADVGKLAGEAQDAGKTSATSPQKTPGILDIVRSSAADTFNWATQGLSGSTMLDGLLGGLNPFVADAIKPITSAAGGKLDEWIGAGRNTVTDFINGRPKQMPAVTDLAASSAAVPVARDSEASKTDSDALAQLKLIVTRLEELAGITKDGQKDTTNPSDTQHSAQPAPNPNIPTEGWGTALAELLRGVL
ncbi:hypothetical protein UXN85_20995 [Enterobacter hormaechei]